ncbi:MAG TPA: hypothetical protein VMB78_03750 [Dissulfurispiraceae bacterium]|nr:hypothetical protein [Dissulfurispiraceae bacterium]
MKERKMYHAGKKPENIPVFRLFLVCFLISAFFSLSAFAGEKWAGVDESVVEKIAKEHGMEKREPFINTDQGDLLLFVFLIAGAVGGFAAGYYWRIIMVEKAPKIDKNERTKEGS